MTAKELRRLKMEQLRAQRWRDEHKWKSGYFNFPNERRPARKQVKRSYSAKQELAFDISDLNIYKRKIYIPAIKVRHNFKQSFLCSKFNNVLKPYLITKSQEDTDDAELVTGHIFSDISEVQNFIEMLEGEEEKLDEEISELNIQRNRLLKAFKHNELTFSFQKKSAISNLKSLKKTIEHNSYLEKYNEIKHNEIENENSYITEITKLAFELPNPLEAVEALSFLASDHDIRIKMSRILTESKVMQETALYSQDKKAHELDMPLDAEDSLIYEIETLAKDPYIGYVFEIPTEYKEMQKKTVRRGKASSKKLIHYVNDVVDVISYTEDLTRVFPDGTKIIYYSNGDVSYEKDKIIFLEDKQTNKVVITNTETKEISSIFPSGMFEKKLKNGSIFQKKPSGQLLLKRLNGGTLVKSKNQYIKKSKFGKISVIKR